MLEKIIVNVCDTSIVPIEQNPNIVKLKMFAATKKVSGISSSSIDKYVYDIKKFMEIVNKPFEEVTSMDIRWYLAY